MLPLCLVSQRKRARAAVAEVPGDFNGGQAMGPMAMGFNPMMNPMHGMMAQACTHCVLLVSLACALLEWAIAEAAAQGFSLAGQPSSLMRPWQLGAESDQEILRLAPRPDNNRQGLSGNAVLCSPEGLKPLMASKPGLAASQPAPKLRSVECGA